MVKGGATYRLRVLQRAYAVFGSDASLAWSSWSSSVTGWQVCWWSRERGSSSGRGKLDARENGGRFVGSALKRLGRARAGWPQAHCASSWLIRCACIRLLSESLSGWMEPVFIPKSAREGSVSLARTRCGS